MLYALSHFLDGKWKNKTARELQHNVCLLCGPIVNNVCEKKRQRHTKHKALGRINVIVSECHHTNWMLCWIHLNGISCNLKCIWCHRALTICLHKPMITFQQGYWNHRTPYMHIQYTLRMTQCTRTYSVHTHSRTRAGTWSVFIIFPFSFSIQ